MAKTTINAVCDNIHISKNQSSVRFVVEETQTAPVAQRLARTIVNVNFNDPAAVKDFKVGEVAEIVITQK